MPQPVLAPKLTTPYKFYQFWLNVSDVDAEKYIKIFTLLSKEEVAALVGEQEVAPHLRPLQKRLAKEVTCMVHSEVEYDKAVHNDADTKGAVIPRNPLRKMLGKNRR